MPGSPFPASCSGRMWHFSELSSKCCLGVPLKLCTSDWDLNPRGWDSNPAKTHSLPTEITHLVSGLNDSQVLFF